MFSQKCKWARHTRKAAYIRQAYAKKSGWMQEEQLPPAMKHMFTLAPPAEVRATEDALFS